MSDQIRLAIQSLVDCQPVTVNEIAKGAKIPQSSLARFLANERNISLASLDKLDKYLNTNFGVTFSVTFAMKGNQ